VPEGDTIHRAAQTMNRALKGDRIVSFETGYAHVALANENAPVVGRTVALVEAAGKHLLVRFSGDLVLRTHMRMNGSWHLYRPGERWQKPASDMRVCFATERFVAVGFNVPDAELVSTQAILRGPVGELGPDLLAPDFDAAEALRRLRERAELPLGEALLRQRSVAGIGNVYKSELLFLAGLSPFAKLATASDDALTKLLANARRLLQANARDTSEAAIVTYRGLRRTTGRADPGERLYAYGRSGKPCRNCGAAIAFAKQGLEARVTYWCPRCQPAPVSG